MCSGCYLQAIRDFTAATNKKLGIQMYPYSIFHIFFEQYLYVVRDSIWLLGGALLGVLAVCWAFTASLWASSIILLVVGMILMDLLGVMYLWGIQLNAVSVVNLTMALGIAVEFCAHIVHAFLVAPGGRAQRMQTALQDMGASVLSGITITKFAGMEAGTLIHVGVGCGMSVCCCSSVAWSWSRYMCVVCSLVMVVCADVLV